MLLHQFDNVILINSMSHHLRPAQLQDAASLAELSGVLGYPSGKKSLESRLQQLLQKDDHCVFVALQNESIIGWVHGFYSLRVESDPISYLAIFK